MLSDLVTLTNDADHHSAKETKLYNSMMIVGTGVAALLAGAPMLLPSTTVVTRRRRVAASPSDVFSLLESSRGYQTFNPYCDTDPELDIQFFGPSEGIGAGFRFQGREGKGTQTITALRENREVTVEIDLGSMGRPTTTFTLTPTEEGGTDVTWTTTLRAGHSPLRRIFGLFAERFLGPTYERGLDNLKRAFS